GWAAVRGPRIAQSPCKRERLRPALKRKGAQGSHHALSQACREESWNPTPDRRDCFNYVILSLCQSAFTGARSVFATLSRIPPGSRTPFAYPPPSSKAPHRDSLGEALPSPDDLLLETRQSCR